MFLVTWIEGEEVNYRIVEQKDLSKFQSKGQNTIIQRLGY